MEMGSSTIQPRSKSGTFTHWSHVQERSLEPVLCLFQRLCHYRFWFVHRGLYVVFYREFHDLRVYQMHYIECSQLSPFQFRIGKLDLLVPTSLAGMLYHPQSLFEKLDCSGMFHFIERVNLFPYRGEQVSDHLTLFFFHTAKLPSNHRYHGRTNRRWFRS